MADRFASQTKPSPEVLRPELVIPGAARTGHFKKIRKAKPFIPQGFCPPGPGKSGDVHSLAKNRWYDEE
jgi:hypothetical protein